MEYFNFQPEDIKLEILSRLPTDSVLESKLVCTNWRNIVSHHPLFSKMHLQHLNHAQDSELKTGCCDTDQCSYSTSGFGYVSSTNEYKIVGICISKRPYFAQAHIYTLGSGNGWRNLGKFSVGPFDLWGRCIFANGALYWMSGEVGIISTFDLAEEKFCEHLSSPPLPPDNEWYDNRVGVLDGFLIFAMFGLGVGGDECYDIWLKKERNDNHGMKELEEHQSSEWSKKFRVDKSKLLAITMSNDVLSGIDNYGNIYDKEVHFKEW